MHNKPSISNYHLVEKLTACFWVNWRPVLSVSFGLALMQAAEASENVPHRPFALWADLPLPKEFVFGLVYEESEAYDIWANGNHEYSVRYKQPRGESYGIDINQGYV